MEIEVFLVGFIAYAIGVLIGNFFPLCRRK